MKPRNTESGTPVLVRLDRERLDRLDEWRRQEPDIPTRSEAVRRAMDFAFRFPLFQKYRRAKP